MNLEEVKVTHRHEHWALLNPLQIVAEKEGEVVVSN